MNILHRQAVRFPLLTALLFAALSANLPAQSSPNQDPLPDAPQPAQNQPSESVRSADTAKGPQQTYLGAPLHNSLDITFLGTPKRMVFDEKDILASPFRLRIADARWLVPLAAASGILIGTDAHSMTLEHINANDQNRANKLTDGTVGVLGALPAGMLLWGSVGYSSRARETGLLAAESLGDSLILSEAGKAFFRRDSPLTGNRQGEFFNSSFSDASFPSNHAAAAWSLAAVIGDEYPGWLTRTVVYTLAGTTSVGRIVAEKHFPSDVLVGSALGWLVGHYVFRAHHNYDLTPYEDPPPSRSTFAHPRVIASAAMPLPSPPSAETAASMAAQSSSTPAAPSAAPGPNLTTKSKPSMAPDRPRPYDNEEADPDTLGSTNVPMDSWVYPALERLAAMGFIPSQSIAIRPWTRLECARQVAEAADLIAGDEPVGDGLGKGNAKEAERLIDALQREFDDRENASQSLVLESVYARYGTIAGPALADSFHFGQTWWNDFGRPLGRGSSALLGFSMRATEGRLFVYGREEVQYGPGAPAYSAATEQLIAELDSNPVQTSVATSSYTRYRPIELYAGVAFDGNALSFGKQQLFWGPTTMGPLMFSSNAEPTYNLNFVATRPHPLPFFPNLGSYRFDIAIGKLSGHSYPARPWYNAQKANFKFGQDLELSFTRWSILWGVGHPMTLGSLLHDLENVSSADIGPLNPRTYPGAFDSGFDFRYRLPWLRKLVTVYADGYSNDDPNPVDAPRRAMWNPGIYFARMPWLPHMDLRVEAVSSEQLARDLGGDYYYYKNYYHDESTNKGFLLGNAIGRDSRAEEARLGWWVSAQTRLELGYRQSKGGHLPNPKDGALPAGSTVTDGFLNARVQISRHWNVQIFAQYERFLMPDYMAGSQTNKSGWLQLTWTPDKAIRQ